MKKNSRENGFTTFEILHRKLRNLLIAIYVSLFFFKLSLSFIKVHANKVARLRTKLYEKNQLHKQSSRNKFGQIRVRYVVVRNVLEPEETEKEKKKGEREREKYKMRKVFEVGERKGSEHYNTYTRHIENLILSSLN